MAKAALLIIDVLNTFDFPGGDDLLAASGAIADPITKLRAAAREADCPAIYVNDNYARWRDEPSDLVRHLSADGMRGADLARRLAPEREDYFVVKPESSGFYATTLPALLPRLGVDRLVLTGMAVDICVLFTASDAHMREYPLWVPTDTVAGENADRAAWAMHLMRETLSVETRPTTELSLADWLAND